MRTQRFGDRYIARVESGERVIETLIDLLRREGIGFASLTAAGAIRWARLGFWEAERRSYSHREFVEQLEVVSFLGNAAIRGDDPFLHVHVALGRGDFSVVGGHLAEAIVHPTLEVWIRSEPGEVRRVKDPESGLDLLDLAADHDATAR